MTGNCFSIDQPASIKTVLLAETDVLRKTSPPPQPPTPKFELKYDSDRPCCPIGTKYIGGGVSPAAYYRNE